MAGGLLMSTQSCLQRVKNPMVGNALDFISMHEELCSVGAAYLRV